jgi:hypothetical protein
MTYRAANHRTARAVALGALLLLSWPGIGPASTSGLRAIEQAIEARAEQVLLPSGPLSSLTVTPCMGCPPRSFLATAGTLYIVNGEQSTLEALRRVLVANPLTAVAVFYDTDRRELTRVVVRAP